MKKIVFPAIVALSGATSALAADLPRRALPPAVPVAVPVFTWTGFYAGLNAGYGWSHTTARTEPYSATSDLGRESIAFLGLDSVKYKTGGFVGGGQAGYNHQFTPGSGFVVGVETDIDFADLKRKRGWTRNFNGASQAGYLTEQDFISTRSSLDFLGTVRGRAGYAFDRVFLYGTGGLAYGQVGYRHGVDVHYAFTATGANPITGDDLYDAKSNQTQTGYAYGGGIEYALPADSVLNFGRSSGVTLKAEYLHYDLGKHTVTGYTPATATTRDAVTSTKIRSEGDLIRAGLNYKFGIN